MPQTPNTLPSTPGGSPASAGSPALDPMMRAFLEARWRTCITELRSIAPLLGWVDRLPPKAG